MTIYVNNSGTWSLAKEVYVNDSGTWKEPQEVYINDGGTWKLVHKVIYITSSALNINLASLAGNPTSPIRLKVVINSGVSIYSSASTDRKSTRLNSSHMSESRMPSSA